MIVPSPARVVRRERPGQALEAAVGRAIRGLLLRLGDLPTGGHGALGGERVARPSAGVEREQHGLPRNEWRVETQRLRTARGLDDRRDEVRLQARHRRGRRPLDDDRALRAHRVDAVVGDVDREGVRARRQAHPAEIRLVDPFGVLELRPRRAAST